MTAHVIDGKSYAAQLRARLAGQVRDLAAHGARPGLATLVVGDSYPAHAYERRLSDDRCNWSDTPSVARGKDQQ